MDNYERALIYFERSIEIYGQHAGTLFNMAACCQLTGQSARAESLLRKVLEYDPDNQQARALLAGAEA
jgi:Tfp pilus assembly protein PilF